MHNNKRTTYNAGDIAVINLKKSVELGLESVRFNYTGDTKMTI